MYTSTFMLAISKNKNAVILLKHRTNAMYVTKHLLSPEISMNTNALGLILANNCSPEISMNTNALGLILANNCTVVKCVTNCLLIPAASTNTNAFILLKNHIVMFVTKHLLIPAASINTNAFILLKNHIVVSVTKYLLRATTSRNTNASMRVIPQVFLHRNIFRALLNLMCVMYAAKNLDLFLI